MHTSDCPMMSYVVHGIHCTPSLQLQMHPLLQSLWKSFQTTSRISTLTMTIASQRSTRCGCREGGHAYILLSILLAEVSGVEQWWKHALVHSSSSLLTRTLSQTTIPLLMPSATQPMHRRTDMETSPAVSAAFLTLLMHWNMWSPRPFLPHAFR